MTEETPTIRRVPNTTLGFLENGDLQTIEAERVFSNGRIVTIGIPGAFTPVCTEQHVPDFIRSTHKLKQSGFSNFVCIASNDPFVLDAWARQLDPKREILFLSDGNLEFARALDATSMMPSLLVGERSERFMMITWNGIIEHFRIESNVLTYSCTRPEDALQLAVSSIDV